MKCKNSLNKLNNPFNILLWGIGTLVVYYTLFSNQHLLMVEQKSYLGAIYSMAIIFVAALFYGNVVSIIIKNTVERAIAHRQAEERSR